MKLLFLDHSNDFYGGQKSLEGFIKLIKQERQDIDITCIFNSRNLKWRQVFETTDSVSIIFLNHNLINPLRYIYFLIKVYNCITTRHIDLIHANTFKSAIAVLPLKLVLRAKFVFRARLGIDYNSHGLVDFLIYKYFDKIICNSEYVANSFRKKYKKINSNNKISVIYNGLSDELIKNLKASKAKQNFVIASIGRFEKIKNQLELLEAVKILKKNGIKNEVRLYGSPSKLDNGEYFQKLKFFIDYFNLNDMVNFFKYEEDIIKIYESAGVVVVTSESEALSRVCFESFFSMVPVIASNIDGNKEIITHSVNGILYELGNPKDLADKIQSLISFYSSSKILDLRSHAFEYAMQNFRASKNYISEIELLQRFVNES